jgi:predicted acyl esterase
MSIVIDENIMGPMHDGIKLATDFYRPAKEGQWPVLLTRVPAFAHGRSHERRDDDNVCIPKKPVENNLRRSM